MASFTGTERFTILKRLGSGGFGVVYEAFDHERQRKVALKVPHEANAFNIYMVKQEFRALADVTHPNLVSLYELLAQGPDWFFTMELVEGPDFHRRLRPEERGGKAGGDGGSSWRERDPATSDLDPDATRVRPRYPFWGPGRLTQGVSTESSALSRNSDTPSSGEGGPSLHHSPPRDYQEVRELTRQLAEGLQALHLAGKLHRDIKPTNVLVTREGRVVLVDFGLAVDLAPVPGSQARPSRVAGTPAYMAPERIGGQAPNEASDWYSVGVMLYRALTGQLPFPGKDMSAVINKISMDPVAPALLVPETPQDLSDLCLELLARNQAQRPSGREILARLGEPAGTGPAAPGQGRVSVSEAMLIGRRPELEALRQAFEASLAGKAATAMVQGGSGMGKSFLLRHFLWEIQRENPKAVVLAGRCYEQESMPFKALDSLVDALTHYLLGLPQAKLVSLLPLSMPYLARMFPVLRRLQGIGAGPVPGASPDPLEFRERAFTALRQLLHRLGERHPLVLFIDDLQWGDRDSSALLASLLLPPDTPSMLVLACHRTEDGQVSPVVREFQERLSAANAETMDIPLGELPEPDACLLAQALLGPGFAEAEAKGAWIARESGGSPFFISELSQHVLAALDSPPGLGPLGAPFPQTLDQYIRNRVEALPEDGRQVLEVLALAGHPVDWQILVQTCVLGQPKAELITKLRAAHFIRTRGRGRNLLETFHDRIRVSVARDIQEPRARDIHLRLALAMEAAPGPDPQALALHFQHAGELDKASGYAERAAEQATMALAFEQAAHFFRLALDLRQLPPGERGQLLLKLGGALANAGLGFEAAQAYQEASRDAKGHEAIRLQRMSAEQWFRCGNFDQGMAALQAVIATLGMAIPPSPWRALVSSILRRVLIQIRGLGFRLRPESEIPREDLDRIDICWAGAMGLGPIDHIRGGDFQARQLALTLKAGEPYRMVRALAHETVYVAHRGSRSQVATQRMLATTLALAEKLGAPGPMGRAYIAAGTAALMQGRWKAGMELHEKAEALLRENCSGMDYEIHISQHHGLVCHWILGDVRVVEARLGAGLKAARDKADLLTATNLRTSVAPYLYLAQDQPDRAASEIRQAMANWSSAGFHIQHYNALAAQANIHLYQGEPGQAAELISAQWRPFRRSLLLRVQGILITMLELRARVALALAQSLAPGAPERAVCLKSARADRRALERETTPYSDAFALKLRAQEALVLARDEEAAALFFRAEIAFGACDMRLHVMAMRHVRGQMEGRAGTGHLEEAESWMREQGILHPGRFVRMHGPVPVGRPLGGRGLTP